MSDPKQKIEDVSGIVGEYMDEILACFKPGSLITVLVRQPSHPGGERDFVLTSDTIDDAIAALHIHKKAH